MREISLRQLEALKRVVDTGTVSRAAQHLGISQPAASKLIQDLESYTTFKLFDRVGGRLLPTENCLDLYAEIARIFNGAHQISEFIEELKRRIYRNLVIGIEEEIPDTFIATALSKLPVNDLSISIKGMRHTELIDPTLSNGVDVALLNSEIDDVQNPLERIGTLPILVVLPQRHRLCALKEIRAEDLREESIILSGCSSTRHRIDSLLLDYGVSTKLTLLGRTALTAVELVASGLGIALCDALSVDPLAKQVEIRQFCPEINITYSIIRRSSRERDEFVNCLVAEFRQVLSRKKVLDRIILE